MADFKIHSTPSTLVTKTLDKASATVLEEGDMCTLDTGLAIKAVAASAALAYVCESVGVGDTEVIVVATPGVVYEGTGDANFAVAQRGTEVDLVGTTTLLIDVGASTTDVFKIEPGTDAGTVGSTAGILVTINKPL